MNNLKHLANENTKLKDKIAELEEENRKLRDYHSDIKAQAIREMFNFCGVYGSNYDGSTSLIKLPVEDCIRYADNLEKKDA